MSQTNNCENHFGFFDGMNKWIFKGRKMSDIHSQSLSEINDKRLFSIIESRRLSTASVDSDLDISEYTDVTSKSSKLLSSTFTAMGDRTTPKFFFPYDSRDDLPEYFISKARRELGETPEKRLLALEELKRMIQDAKKDFRMDDPFLLTFLRPRKFDASRAFRAMDSYLEIKIQCETYYFDEWIAQDEINKKAIQILPYRDSQGAAIVVYRLGKFHPDSLSVNGRLKEMFYIVSALVENRCNQVAGFVSIIDLTNISLRWLRYTSMKNIKAALFIAFKALPVRVKAFHIVNMNFIFLPILRLIQRLGPTKITKRTHIHGKNMTSLLKHFQSELLPPEYGGTMEEPPLVINMKDALNCFLVS